MPERGVGTVIVICPTCGTSVMVVVRLNQVLPMSGYLNVNFKPESVEHTCEETNV